MAPIKRGVTAKSTLEGWDYQKARTQPPERAMSGAFPAKFQEIVTEFSVYTKTGNQDVFQSIPKSSSKWAVIVEMREDPLMEAVLRNFIFYLAPKGWAFMIYHGLKNQKQIETITADWKTVHTKRIDKDNLQISEYSQLLTSTDFYNGCSDECEWILVFQLDTFLRSSDIDRFCCYDYVGAPWAHWIAVPSKSRVGNGGLSLRNKAAMLRILEKDAKADKPARPNCVEDTFFCIDYQNDLKFPSKEEASLFSVETTYHPAPVGYHKPWSGRFSHDILWQDMRKWERSSVGASAPVPTTVPQEEPLLPVPFRFAYGIDSLQSKDVTDVVLQRCREGNIINITGDDRERNVLFGDPLFGRIKQILVRQEGDIIKTFELGQAMRLSLRKSNLHFRYGLDGANSLDITEKVLHSCQSGNVITIPKGGLVQDHIFTDPYPLTVKQFVVEDRWGTVKTFPQGMEIILDMNAKLDSADSKVAAPGPPNK